MSPTLFYGVMLCAKVTFCEQWINRKIHTTRQTLSESREFITVCESLDND
jgi:hypothetical protein